MYEKAVKFATKAHEGAVRKYTGVPYITHPIAVAELVRVFDPTPEVWVAAVLHDVVEDTPVTLEEIEAEFGPTVAELVKYVTNVAGPEVGNRKAKFAINASHFADGPAGAQNIKIADAIHNMATLEEYDPKFYRTYRIEKAALNMLMTKAHPGLTAILTGIINGKKGEIK